MYPRRMSHQQPAGLLRWVRVREEEARKGEKWRLLRNTAVEEKPSTISMAWLYALRHLHVPPIKQVVYLRSYPVNPVGNLISRRASHLDAFSAYPCRT